MSRIILDHRRFRERARRRRGAGPRVSATEWQSRARPVSHPCSRRWHLAALAVTKQLSGALGRPSEQLASGRARPMRPPHQGAPDVFWIEDMTEAESEPSLLSASWRNLARLPNLILLPGLAARQARESLASAAKVSGDAFDSSSNDRHLTAAAENDFAQIYRLASAASASDERGLQTQRKVALKTGRPPSPSPSPSPPASLLGSRQSSNDSICTTDKGSYTHKLDSASRRGRGVASLPEADRDPSAYVSGLGQPIDPDTELSSVVQLQTFRSRSRSRPAAGVGGRGRATDRPHRDAQHPGADGDKEAGATGATSPRKLGSRSSCSPQRKTERRSKHCGRTKPSARCDLSEPRRRGTHRRRWRCERKEVTTVAACIARIPSRTALPRRTRHRHQRRQRSARVRPPRLQAQTKPMSLRHDREPPTRPVTRPSTRTGSAWCAESIAGRLRPEIVEAQGGCASAARLFCLRHQRG